MIEVECERCGGFFEAAESLAGGLTNSPAGGKATEVPGLRDEFFRVVQVGMAVLRKWKVRPIVACPWTVLFAVSSPTRLFSSVAESFPGERAHARGRSRALHYLTG